MRATFTSFLVLALAGIGSASAALAKKAACNADNCARAVTGTAGGPASQSKHLADCSSYMLATLSFPTPTVTVTVTPSAATGVTTQTVSATAFVTVTTTSWTVSRATSAEFMKRDNIGETPQLYRPTDIPAYASACMTGMRYSSACACGGVQATTISVTPPAVTETVTASPSPGYTVVTETDIVATATTVATAVPIADRVGAPCDSILQSNGQCFQVQCNKYPIDAYPLGAYAPTTELECIQISLSQRFVNWVYWQPTTNGYCVLFAPNPYLNFGYASNVDFLKQVACP